MRRTEQRQIVASAARTASGNTPDLKAPLGCNARFLIAVTAVSGTSPTLVVTAQGKTAAGHYVDILDSSTFTTTGSACLEIDKLPPTYRLAWTIGGTTPSFTFDVDVVLETEE